MLKFSVSEEVQSPNLQTVHYLRGRYRLRCHFLLSLELLRRHALYERLSVEAERIVVHAGILIVWVRMRVEMGVRE